MPARSEIDDKFKWAVSDLYSSDEAWEKDYNSILELTDQPSELKGRMGESAGMLYKALKEYEQVEYITERVYVYAFMKYYEDTGNSKYQEISGKAQMAAMKVSEKYAGRLAHPALKLTWLVSQLDRKSTRLNSSHRN